MNAFVLYLVLLKATVSAFSGMTVIPVMRDELVVKRHAITDDQLNTAIVIGRSTPGPNGLHVVCVGFFAAGYPGALAGLLALVTPALLAIPLLSFLRSRQSGRRIRSAIRSVVVASVGLMVGTAYDLSASALNSPASWGVAALALFVLVASRVDTVWVIAASAVAMLALSLWLPGLTG
ncbi:MAG: chromate transporter [Bryobacterales bacterium]|nr:chromate transporter [Bryobacterales bacterium]